MKKLVGQLGMLVLACLAVRLAAMLLEPAIPFIVVIFFIVALGWWVLGGRSGPGGYR